MPAIVIAERVEHQTLGSPQAELFQARIPVDQLAAKRARHLDTVNPTTAHLDETTAGAARSLTGPDGAIPRIHRRFTQRRGAARPEHDHDPTNRQCAIATDHASHRLPGRLDRVHAHAAVIARCADGGSSL
jgi:hypothetical protein